MLSEWFDKYCQTINVSVGALTENEDFQLFIVSNGTDEEASISCSCGIKVQLTKNHHTFSLNDEGFQYISMTAITQSSDSSIVIGNTADTIQSSKRSIGVHNKGVQKKQRTKR
ncbi:unnamed protein product [Rotaria socialis]|uniref:Uncharacterized protein n=1 Tax=Rotaria socialis TaxID=392032 RepID=A0A818WIU7_9BILA|nr:unnamed protein product [Rotaria socialis]